MMPARAVGENAAILPGGDVRREQAIPNGNSTITAGTEPGTPRLPRQIVTLLFLGERLPADLITEHMARELGETSVIVVRLKRERDANEFLNGEFRMPAVLTRREEGYYHLNVPVKPQEPPSVGGIASLLSTLSRHFRHVLIALEESGESEPWVNELVVRADLSYVFFDGTVEGVNHLERTIKEARARVGKSCSYVKPVACLGPANTVSEFDLLAEKMAKPVHMFVRCSPMEPDSRLMSPAKMFCADVRRLGREVGGRLVGLALSSGAAKGFAHIGVIQVFEENGIEVDVIAGSSMGAYVGSLWAQGNPGPELERLARELEGRWPLWTLIDPVFPPRQGFVRGYAIKRRLMRTLGEARFGELATPFRAVATNLETLERVVFSGGEVAAAVHASIAVPGICVPISIDGETYIDGGIVDPLPVDVLREMGITRVIAVDVIPTPERIRCALQAEQEVAKRARRRGIFRRKNPINEQFNYFAKGNLFEILMRSIQGAQIRVAQASGREADVLLQPEIRDDRWLDYRNPGKFIKLGREAAERQLEEIRALVSKKERDADCNGRRMEPLAEVASDANRGGGI